MTKYQELIEKSDECTIKATKFMKKKNFYLARFYKNASEGFKQKALKLKVSD